MTPTTGDIAKAARIQLVNWKMVFGMPWAVMATSLVVNIVVYAATSVEPSHRTTGGLASIYATMMITNLLTVTQVFPFSVAMSVTRAAFVAAMVLIMAAESLVDGILLTVLRYVETGTGGWGVHMHFLDLGYIRQDNAVAQALVYTTPLFVLSLACVAGASIYRRWSAPGLWVTVIGAIVTAGLVIIAIAGFHWAHALGAFFTGQPPLALLAAYPLVLAALLGLATTRMLLRARV